jgi:hypothetical protein
VVRSSGTVLFDAASSSSSSSGDTTTTTTSTPLEQQLATLKADLVKQCRQKSPKATRTEIQSIVTDLETVAEQIGIGQSSSFSGLLNGEWELLYAPEDETRSSPFFWAFAKAFPENADQIFGITDAIPAPLKEIGSAFQEIDMTESAQTGSFVSRVKVATLGGMATSIMTTRGTILGPDGVDGIRLKIETTKPEESTIVKTVLGPLADIVNENAPPFPSGEALERIRPGSSGVILRTTFCDEGLRITRNGEKLNDIYVWRRTKFGSYENIL